MKRVHPTKRAATVAVLLLGAAAIIAYMRRPAVVEVDTAVAQRMALRQTVDQDGKTRVRDRFVIAAPVAGHLRRLTLREGDLIEPGQVVAWIEPLPLDETTRRQADARVASAEALASEAASRVWQTRGAAAQAHRTLERREALLAAGAVSPESREQAVLEARSADEELAAADARARAAKSDVDAARAALLAAGNHAVAVAVRSPARGRVLRIPEISARVTSAGTPILELGDAQALEIVADVLSADAVRLCPGQDVDVVEWGGDRPLLGHVRSIEPAAFTRVSALGVDEQRVNVVVDFAEPMSMLGDGFRVEVRIVLWEGRNVLAVPASATFQRGDGAWSVFVVEGGRARRRDVIIGHRTSGGVEILNGIAPGAEVVLFPSDQVRDGARVRQRA
jgi:HlyD family secretion protein